MTKKEKRDSAVMEEGRVGGVGGCSGASTVKEKRIKLRRGAQTH